MNTEERLTRAKVKLLIDQPWFGQLACYIIPRENNYISTACINERGDFYYNKNFVDTLSDIQIKTLLCHEILHLAFRHPFRNMAREATIWNIACDLKVNEELGGYQFELPSGALIPSNGEWKFSGHTIKDIDKKNSELIYDEIMKMIPPSVKSIIASLTIQLSPQKGKGSSGKALDKLPQPWKDLIKKLIRDLVKSDKRMTKAGMDVSKSEQRNLEKDWQQRINQANQNAGIGNIPAGLARELQELENPELPWHQIIRQRLSNVTRRRTWTKPAKKFLPMYFPGVKAETGLNAVVALDTSGSMSSEDITKALSETLGLARSFPSIHLWILSSDAKVWDMIEVKNGNASKIKEICPRGGGGTQFRPIFEMIKKKFEDRIDCLIFFTDGYCSDEWPKKLRYQVYWVSRSKDVKWPYGKAITLN